jgi:hypothetical protein
MMSNADGVDGFAGVGMSVTQHQPAGHSDHASRKHQDMAAPDLQLAEQLQQQLAGLELLAEAVSLLATGQAAAAGIAAASAADAKDSSSDFSFSAGRTAATAAGAGSSGQEALVGPGPQLLRLHRLLQTGQVGRKMDWFDPVLLQKMVSEPSMCTSAQLCLNCKVNTCMPACCLARKDCATRLLAQ